MIKYFGTDGIRGKAYSYLSFDLAYKVGRSLEKLGADKIVIGYDTRQSSVDLLNALASGAKDSNLQIINAGIVPTSAIAFYSKKTSVLGVMITASHNHYEDNGIKIFLNGYKLTNQQELLIEGAIDSIDKVNVSNLDLDVDNGVKNDYVKFLRTFFNQKIDLKVAIDCANGAAFFIANEIFSDLSENLVLINNNPNGKNINQLCGPTNPDVIKKYVVENNFDLGISFDGDADRIAVVDSLGNIYLGDELAYIFAVFLKNNSLLKNNTIVLTYMSNIGLVNTLRQNDITSILVDVGDKNISQMIVSNDYSLGAEPSGHIIFGNLITTADALLASLCLIKVLVNTKKSLSGLTNNLLLYPTKLKNLKNIDKNKVFNQQVINKVKQINEVLAGDGLLMVRPSGTEDLIRVSCCAKDELQVNKYIDDIIDLIKNV